MNRLSRVHVNRRGAWLPPAAAGLALTVFLSWGAWVSAHDPKWPGLGHAWWRVALRPASDETLLAALAVWLVALICFWWPRKRAPAVIGLTVVAMVLIGGVLGTAALLPCRGGETRTVVAAWVLGLYVGNPPSAYQTPVCPGQPPLALQLGQIVCLAATLIGAVAAAAVLWRQPLERFRARFVKDAIVFTGLDAMTMPLLHRLAETRRPASIVVIEPDGSHPLLDEARATGVHVIVGDPASARILLPVFAGWRGCALNHLYALWPDVAENETIFATARTTLGRYRPDPERQPHLVMRIDDPRHAQHWRGWHAGSSGLYFEDALSSQESTAAGVASQVARTGAQQLVLCGDSTLALATLLELARQAWEQQELRAAAAIGRGARPGAHSHPEDLLAPFPLERVLLLDRRSRDLWREYLATCSRSMSQALPAVIPEPNPWQEQLLAMLDDMTPAAAAETAVVIADAMSDRTMHEAGRVARLHPAVPVFVLTSDGAGTSDAIFDLLRPFHRSLLVDREVPPDAWTRVARHWHECFRLRHPAVPGDPRTSTRRPWAALEEFIRQDNILQLRSIMTSVVERGRRWVPARSVALGSFIELNEHELERIARAEHTRWFRRRRAAGWSARGERPVQRWPRKRAALINNRVVPWAELPGDEHAGQIEYLRSQLAQLEDVGFLPIVPAGGPPGAAQFQRIGTVEAKRLGARRMWTRRPGGDELCGDAGDWRVLDDSGDERTVRDDEFRASHEPLGGDRWLRTGTFTAWQVSETQILRTIEGRAVARARDWVVEGRGGERWPVTDEQFQRTYRPSNGHPATSDRVQGSP